LLCIGFFPLIFGANLLVNSASSLANRLRIPPIVIGMTIVAFGTSAPELVVNVFASLNKSPEITLGNILGSNIFNILVILGISAIIYPLIIKKNTTWIEIPLCLLSALVVTLSINDMFFEKKDYSELGFIDGVMFLFFFIIFLVYTFYLLKTEEITEELSIKHYPVPLSILYIIIGIAGLIIGGRLIVISATEIARDLKIPERIIGLTIISIGTSLPELATSVTAALKKNTDIAVGNIVGSNIFNIFLILGLSAAIYPVPLQKGSPLDLLVNIGASLLLFLFVFTGKGRKIERWEGGIFLAIYLIYITVIILRVIEY
ncbi:MAG: calcium/sodium antiporter, partial [Spirochaetales bacterium]|nr:calcium/sodium antiporter [Spirochaetales bacterium]